MENPNVIATWTVKIVNAGDCEIGVHSNYASSVTFNDRNYANYVWWGNTADSKFGVMIRPNYGESLQNTIRDLLETRIQV